MEYILDENGNIKIGPNGQPMVKTDTGVETEIDAIGAQAKITAITKESNDRRKALGEANTKLEAFTGIEDPKAALDAIQKVASYDKDVTTQLDNLKGTINSAWETKEATWNTEKDAITAQLFDANVLTKFATSKVAGTLILPAKIAANEFKGNFNADGTAKDKNGNPIYSTAKPGEPAGFDEALEILISQHPDKDSLLRATGQPGGDAHKTGTGEGGPETKSSHDLIKAGLAARQK